MLETSTIFNQALHDAMDREDEGLPFTMLDEVVLEAAFLIRLLQERIFELEDEVQ